MPTFLVTSRMNPALRARVEKAVTGGHSASPRTMRRVVAIARVVFVLTFLFGLRSFVSTRRRDAEELDRARRELAQRATERATALDPTELAAVSRVSSWLSKLSAPTFEELVAEDVRGPGALERMLREPFVWVRGPFDGFATAERSFETVRASGKDAFVYCLQDPPAQRTEKAVLEKVHLAQVPATNEERTAHVRRFQDAVVGLPLLAPAWIERVRGATEQTEVNALRRDWEHAPIDRAIAAAKASRLLVALDEPGDQPGPTELDGERSHIVRVALVDLAASKLLYASRRRVDPSWISEKRRPTLAMALDSCALAFDVLQGVAKK